MDLIKGLEDSMDIEAPRKLSDDGQSAAETLAIEQLTAGTGETEHPISQHQSSHDENAARPSSKKRGRGTPPLDKEEQKKRKQIADQKSRAKKRAEVEKTKVDLKTTKKKVEYLEMENKSLNDKIKSTKQKLKNAATQIGQLTSLIERSNEETDSSKQQDHVRKLEKELQGLKIEYDKLECENASLKLERDKMTRHLQASNTEEILPWEEIFGTPEQLQFENIFPNEQNHVEKLPMEQEQLGLEENGGLYFVGDGRPITTIVEGEIQELKSMLMTIMTQMDALKTSTLMAIEQISQRMSALETRNPPSQD